MDKKNETARLYEALLSVPGMSEPTEIRNLIYTTNTIEGYHRQIRKVTKNKGVITSDMALLKLIYPATERIARKWTVPLHSWAVSASQLKIIFGDRMKTDL